jgi:hypothetical protein
MEMSPVRLDIPPRGTGPPFDHQRIMHTTAQRIYGELGDEGKAQREGADWLVIPVRDQMLIMRCPCRRTRALLRLP